jgi:hypothetical protein
MADFAGDFSETSGPMTGIGQKTVIYGTGGIGKSELAMNIQQLGITPKFLDLDGGTKHLDVQRIGISNWSMLRAALQRKSLFDGFGAVVIDDFTKAEEYAAAHVVATVKNSKGAFVKSIEDYGWGDGFGYLYHEFLLMLGDLDSLARDGKQIICIAHDTTANVPNPAGENFIRYEPRLQSPKSGKDSIRSRVKEWCDHLLFIGYDLFVEDGRATGGGSRTIYTTEHPTCLAKSRQLSQTVGYEQGSSELWKLLLNKGE